MVSQDSKSIVKVTVWAAAGNLAIAALKLFAGIFGRSSALVADSVHSLVDMISDVLVLLMVRFSATRKVERIVTMIISLMMVVAGAELLAGAAGRISVFLDGGELDVPDPVAMWIAIAVILTNEVLYRFIIALGRKLDNKAVIANAWHHRTDAFSSIGVAAGVVLSSVFGGKFAVADPIICIIISIMIINMGVKLFLPSFNKLTRGLIAEEDNDAEDTK